MHTKQLLQGCPTFFTQRPHFLYFKARQAKNIPGGMEYPPKKMGVQGALFKKVLKN